MCNRNFYLSHGLRNILLFPSTTYAGSLFSDFLYFYSRHHSHSYIKLQCNRIEDLGLSDQDIFNAGLAAVKKCIKAVETTFSVAFVRFLGIVFAKVYRTISRGLVVDEGRVAAIKDASRRLAKESCPDLDRCPCVFLPLHSSHLDYLIIAFVAFCFDFPLPYIGAGNNLDIPIVR